MAGVSQAGQLPARHLARLIVKSAIPRQRSRSLRTIDDSTLCLRCERRLRCPGWPVGSRCPQDGLPGHAGLTGSGHRSGVASPRPPGRRSRSARPTRRTCRSRRRSRRSTSSSPPAGRRRPVPASTSAGDSPRPGWPAPPANGATGSWPRSRALWPDGAGRLGDRMAVAVALFGPRATKRLGAALARAADEGRWAAIHFAVAASDLLGPEKLERLLSLDAPEGSDPVPAGEASVLAGFLEEAVGSLPEARRLMLLRSLWERVVAAQRSTAAARRRRERLAGGQDGDDALEPARVRRQQVDDDWVVGLVADHYGQMPSLAQAAQWIPTGLGALRRPGADSRGRPRRHRPRPRRRGRHRRPAGSGAGRAPRHAGPGGLPRDQGIGPDAVAAAAAAAARAGPARPRGGPDRRRRHPRHRPGDTPARPDQRGDPQPGSPRRLRPAPAGHRPHPRHRHPGAGLGRTSVLEWPYGGATWWDDLTESSGAWRQVAGFTAVRPARGMALPAPRHQRPGAGRTAPGRPVAPALRR